MNCKMFKNWEKRNKRYAGYVGSSVADNSSSDTPDTWTWNGQLCSAHGVTLFLDVLEQYLTLTLIMVYILGPKNNIFLFTERCVLRGGMAQWSDS